MSILMKIFGENSQVKIFEAFADHFEQELSVADIVWLTNISTKTVHHYIDKLLSEQIILKGDKVKKKQFYSLNLQKLEVRAAISLINNIVSEKLSQKLEERGLTPL